MESPSLEIFQPRLAAVLCSLLWVTLLRQRVGLGDPQRSPPTPNILSFCDYLVYSTTVHEENHSNTVNFLLCDDVVKRLGLDAVRGLTEADPTTRAALLTPRITFLPFSSHHQHHNHAAALGDDSQRAATSLRSPSSLAEARGSLPLV